MCARGRPFPFFVRNAALTQFDFTPRKRQNRRFWSIFIRPLSNSSGYIMGRNEILRRGGHFWAHARWPVALDSAFLERRNRRFGADKSRPDFPKKSPHNGGSPASFETRISPGSSCVIRSRSFLRSAKWGLGFGLLMSNSTGAILRQNPFADVGCAGWVCVCGGGVNQRESILAAVTPRFN